MELKTIIYTTSRDFWIKRDFDKIYSTIKQAKGVDVSEFTVRYIKLPKVVPTYVNGGTYIEWSWIKANCPADGHNAVCLHISTAERKKLGLKHPDPKSSLGGVYNRDADAIFDFVVIADKRGKSYGNMTAFERIFIHELSHGFSHRRGVTDYTHTWDYLLKNMRGIYLLHDFTTWNNLVKQLSDLQKRLAQLLSEAKLASPVDKQYLNQVSQTFGTPDSSYTITGHHTGVDFRVPIGEPCYAVADGKVTAVYENHASLGNACEYQFTHKGKLYTARYLHLSRPVIQRSYKRGDIIGYTGNTGRSTGPHLHLDISVGVFSLAGVNAQNFREKFIDPLTLIK